MIPPFLMGRKHQTVNSYRRNLTRGYLHSYLFEHSATLIVTAHKGMSSPTKNTNTGMKHFVLYMECLNSDLSGKKKKNQRVRYNFF